MAMLRAVHSRGDHDHRNLAGTSGQRRRNQCRRSRGDLSDTSSRR